MPKELSPLQEKIHEIIFEAETPWGKRFDVVLMIFIFASVGVVMAESIKEYDQVYHEEIIFLEWFFTIVFTIEYGLRLYSVKRPLAYATSFFGVIDLVSILPTYIALLLPETTLGYLLIIRVLRLMRVFRVLKLLTFQKESMVLGKALYASRYKIAVFLMFVVLLVFVIGSVVYIIEGGVNEGFSSIPRSIYWAIVTLTTVGYGDISPITPFGQFFAGVIMILGYAIIAVPTGIVSTEMAKVERGSFSTIYCKNCTRGGHANDAKYCKYCGDDL